MTLEPGDLVLTGTPAGVGTLSPGDVVEVEVVGVSRVRNPVTSDALVPPLAASILHASRVSARDDPAEEAGARSRAAST